MRVFIAVPIPEDIYGKFYALQDQFEAFPLHSTKQFHMTLEFLGEVNDEELTFIKKRLPSLSYPSFTFTISKLGVFPGLSTPRVLWVSSSDSREMNLASSLMTAVNKHLFRELPEDPVPHITLARIPKFDNKKKLIQTITNTSFEPFSFPVEELILFKSELSSDGSKYTPLLSIPLQ